MQAINTSSTTASTITTTTASTPLMNEIKLNLSSFNQSQITTALGYFINHFLDNELVQRSITDDIDLGDECDEDQQELSADAKLCNLLISSNLSAKQSVYILLTQIINNRCNV